MYKLLGNGDICFFSPEGKVYGFPQNEKNQYYQEYLEWIAQGNTPEPPDPEPIIPDVDGFINEIKVYQPLRDWIDSFSSISDALEISAYLTQPNLQGLKDFFNRAGTPDLTPELRDVVLSIADQYGISMTLN